MKRQFHKMHGLGNDFVILDARAAAVTMTEPLAKALADRRMGIGCDQLILIEPSSVADIKMRIWNHDGKEVQSCGNASRCVVALTGAKTIQTAGGIVEGGVVDGAGSAGGNEIEVTLPPPKFAWDEVPVNYPMDTAHLPMAWGPLEHPMALNVGNPHLVFFVADETVIDLDSLGPSIEHDPAFPERINVNVASVRGDDLRLRTWERGSGLTLACGTGACATAVAAIVQKKVKAPVKVKMKGGTLTIGWAPGEPIRMTGPATHVYKGEIELEQFA